MAARLRPWTVGRFLANAPDLPPRGWTNAEALFGPLLSMVAEMLGRCDWQPLSALFDQLLMQELGACQPGNTGIEIVEPFLDQIRRSTAIVAGERDTSIRQVERRVRALTGTSPKRLASLSRFQTARDAIWANPSIGLAQLAIDAGYSDQPHMTREFKRYCGQSPARFARGLAAKKKWLAAQDVAFVQEHPAPDE
jgi:AraC-like DNA-binding protein